MPSRSRSRCRRALADQFRYAQGQHLTLRADIGGDDVRRSYSICSAVQDGALRIAVKRSPGGVFSTWANDALKAGDTIDVMPPLGHFNVPLDAAHARHYLGFAAGSGITPLLSIVKTTLATEPGSRFTLVYANRASGTRDVPRGAGRAQGPQPRPLQPRARAVARGAGRRHAARAHRPREGGRAARALGAARRRRHGVRLRAGRHDGRGRGRAEGPGVSRREDQGGALRREHPEAHARRGRGAPRRAAPSAR